ncbi:MAG: hypothetical protein ACUVWJ_07005 [Spirochaetota bacterium]
MGKETRKRWYDKNPELSNFLEKLRLTETGRRENLIHGIKDIIMTYDDRLMDRHVTDFPLTIKRRWYDDDPYSWMVINTLKYADRRLMQKILHYLKEKL